MDKDRLDRLLEIYPQTFAEDIGIDVEKGTPAPLYQWAVSSILFAKPIGHETAARSARCLFDDGLTTAEHMANASFAQRRDALDRGGYAQYREMMASQLGDGAQWLLDNHKGDLRNLRDDAGCDPAETRKALKNLKGMGDTAADIFLREVQNVWPEQHPFIDKMAIDAARRLGVAEDKNDLNSAAKNAKLSGVVSALVKAELEDLKPDRLNG